MQYLSGEKPLGTRKKCEGPPPTDADCFCWSTKSMHVEVWWWWVSVRTVVLVSIDTGCSELSENNTEGFSFILSWGFTSSDNSHPPEPSEGNHWELRMKSTYLSRLVPRVSLNTYQVICIGPAGICLTRISFGFWGRQLWKGKLVSFTSTDT